MSLDLFKAFVLGVVEGLTEFLSVSSLRIWQIAIGMFSDPAPRRFVTGVLLAFLPAAVVGALAHDFIKSVLFNPWIVCFTLIVGGAVLLWVDSTDLETRYREATK